MKLSGVFGGGAVLAGWMLSFPWLTNVLLGLLTFVVAGAVVLVGRRQGRLDARRRRAELALDANENLFRAIFDSAAAGVAQVGLDGRFLRVNRSFCEIAGYAEGALLQLTFQDITHPDDLLSDVAQARRLAAGELERYSMEKRYIRADGTIVWIDLTASVVRDAAGRTAYYVAVVDDITERVRDRIAMAESETAFEDLYENAPVMYLSVDIGTGRILRCNRTTAVALGYEKGELIGRPIEELYDASCRAEARRGLAQFLETGELQDLELRVCRRDGSLMDVSLRASAVRDAQGRIVASRSSWRDITLRKRAEERLRHALQFNDQVIRSVGEGLVVFDRELRYQLWNRFMEELSGLRAADVLGRRVQDVFPGLLAHGMLGHLERALAGETVTVPDLMETGPAGPVWTSGSLAPLITPAGEVTGVLGSVVDITARKRGESALLHSEARYRVLAEAVSDAIVVSRDGVLIDVNRGFEALAGCRREEAIGRSVLEFVAEEYRDPIMHRLTTGDDDPYDFVGLTLGGERVELHSVSRQVEADGGPIWITALHDVTAQRRSERRLQIQADALQAAANAIALIGGDGTIQWVNAAWESLTGYTAAESVGQNPRLLKSGEQDGAFYAALWKTVWAGRVWQGEIVNRRKDGALYHEEMTITPIVSAAGVVDHFIAVKQDVSPRKSAEAQLLQAQKMESVGRLAGGVAHDFNNLLTVILSTSELLLEQRAPDDPLRSDLEEIRRTAQRAAALTRQLLAFSRRQVLRLEVISLNEVVAGMWGMLQRLIGEDVTMVFEPGAATDSVRADAHQLQQVVLNLVVNARDAMSRGGTLTLTTANAPADDVVRASGRDGPQVVLEVRDTGVGMDEATRTRIFEPFFTTKELGRGSGLGLSTVYGIVNQSGGTIGVESEPGRGTTFRVSLPMVAAAVLRTAPEKPGITTGSGETVLVVEDDVQVCAVAARVLKRAGYLVLTAPTAAAALDVLEREASRVRLVLSDVVMPGMNGLELGRRVAERYPSLRMLFTSGYADHPALREGLGEAGRMFVAKPYTVEELTRNVREALDAPRRDVPRAARGDL